MMENRAVKAALIGGSIGGAPDGLFSPTLLSGMPIALAAGSEARLD